VHAAAAIDRRPPAGAAKAAKRAWSRADWCARQLIMVAGWAGWRVIMGAG